MSTYQQHCEEYALFGNPERDAIEYEIMAEYDRWDGHRMDLEVDDTDCDVCPTDAWLGELWYESRIEEQLLAVWNDHFNPVPF